MDDVAYMKRLIRRKGTIVPAHSRPRALTIASNLGGITILFGATLVLLALPWVMAIVTITGAVAGGN